ncbi:hypothetical protein GJ699_15985 [Duganella sp. FT80W]|uniref:DUF4197 family protein n=1 Tax=Duganella guangzhouensis TaxID=2666084 RepID=A0A6I2L0W2_9BURK|nr:hypothetical protein [Duganella guangzhouensis]MRW91493.1 hypothetical protein [Duganella guangzhouensis]
MSSKMMAAVVAMAIAAMAVPAHAQLGGLSKALGGGNSSSGSVSAESLVKSYVGGTQQVMSADVNFLKALGLKDQADKTELAAKNLTTGATVSSMQDAAQVQTDNSKALDAAMSGNKVALSAESKKNYTLGLVDLVKGIKSYTGVAGDVKGFKPSVSSLGAGAAAAAYVVKSLPDNMSSLKNTLKRSLDFAKENKIEIPADATSLL